MRKTITITIEISDESGQAIEQSISKSVIAEEKEIKTKTNRLFRHLKRELK